MEYRRRTIPSMSGLIAFEATARHLNFSRAAEDLALTQGAVSKRVRQLETVLGIQLLVRNTNQVWLTQVGETYLGHVRKLLGHLQSSTEDIRATATGKMAIRVAVPSAFAARWLMPRLSGLTRAYPNYAVNLMCLCSPEDPHLAEVDCAIMEGQQTWRDAEATLLASSPNIVVASPRFVRARDVGTPSQLACAELLGLNRDPDGWSNWFAATGYNDLVVESARFDDLGVMIEATLQAQGVSIVPQMLVEGEIERGLLLRLFPERPSTKSEYYLGVPRRSRGSAAVSVLAGWLTEQSPGEMPPRSRRQ